MPWFDTYLEPLRAVAAATLDEHGTLIEANAGFLRLVMVDGRQPIGARLARYFLQPDFATLSRSPAAADGEIYRGLLTFGDYDGKTRSLHARLWRVDAQLRLLAEYDIDELERLADNMLELNRDYAKAQIQLAQLNLMLQQREAQITEVSLTDALTGVGNRRKLQEALAQEISRAERIGDSLCAFMADLDHFKRVNDTHGHEAGDKVLEEFGELLRQQTRPTDILARFGGEEFVVLMPHTDLEHAQDIAERVRKALETHRVGRLPYPVTASFGVAKLADGEQADSLLRRIDAALYQAKQSGRNRVIAG